MRTSALELSPYYLQAARRNVDYWARATGNSGAAPTSFLQAAAEDIPKPDNSFDVVSRQASQRITHALVCVLPCMHLSIKN